MAKTPAVSLPACAFEILNFIFLLVMMRRNVGTVYLLVERMWPPLLLYGRGFFSMKD